MKKQFLLIALTACSFASCKKEKEDTTNGVPAPVGFWTGKYGAASTLGLNYAVLLKSDGTMRSYVMSADKTDTGKATTKGAGTWEQEGLQITANYEAGGYTFNTTATANEAMTSMTGTWSANNAFSGGFVLTKQ